jgi:hypothetical protein
VVVGFIGVRSGGVNLSDVDRPELDSEQLPMILRLKTTRRKGMRAGPCWAGLPGQISGLQPGKVLLFFFVLLFFSIFLFSIL